MASEIRVNTINNSSGLGTITISDTGAFFSGITTISDLRITGTSNAGVTTVSAGSASVPSISPSGDTDTGIFFPAADTIGFAEGGAEAARIDSSGRLLIGTTTTHDFKLGGSTYVPQTHLAGGVIQAAAIRASGPYFCFGASTSVSNNTNLGLLSWHGNDGSSFVQAALIEGYVDGTPGTNDMPGRLVFSTTADGASSPTERMRITSAGDVGIGGVTPTRGPLHLHKDGTTNTYIKLTNGVTGSTTADGAEIVVNTSGELLFNNRETQPILFLTQANERARIDSSGRLLVGTSSYSGAEKLVVQGTSTNANGSGMLRLQLGSTPAASTTDIGYVFFGDNAGNYGASILAQSDAAWSSGSSHPTRLMFTTTASGASSPTERMRIQNDGRIIAGTTAAFGSGGLTFLPNYSNGAAALYWNRANTTTQSSVLVFRNDNTNVGSIYYTNTATTYQTSSDYRLKENVALISDGIDRLKQLKPSRFNFIVDPDKIVDGFLAHEVQDIVPEAIGGTKDEVDDEGNPVYQGIDQSKLVPLLTAALQEAIGKIESLETANASLEARLTALEGQ